DGPRSQRSSHVDGLRTIVRGLVVTRILAWDGCDNVRDLGGLATRDGRRTRFGAMVRGDDLTLLTHGGRGQAFDHGVRTILDLRLPTEASPMRSRRFVHTHYSLHAPDGPPTTAVLASFEPIDTYRMILHA